MAGKSSREILMEDLRQMEDGMERLSTTKEDIKKAEFYEDKYMELWKKMREKLE